MQNTCKRRFFCVYIVNMQNGVHTFQPLQSPEHTGEEMMRLVKMYSKDIGNMAKWPFPRFYNFVKNLPYRADPQENEIISRPAKTLQADWPWRDCDDKAVLIASWLQENQIPFKFRASSSRPDKMLHHVYVVADFPAGQKVIDATYSKNILGQEVPYTKIQELTTMSNLHTFEGSPELGISFSRLKRKAKNVSKKAVKVTRQVSKIPLIKQALQVPGLKTALISAIPGGAAILKAKSVVDAALKAAKADKNPQSAAQKAAQAAEAAAAAAEKAKIESVTATDEQKAVLKNQAAEAATQASEAAKIAAKAEGRISTLSGAAKVSSVVWTTKAESAAVRAKTAADSIVLPEVSIYADSAENGSTERPKWVVPAAIGVAAIVGALALKKKKGSR